MNDSAWKDELVRYSSQWLDRDGQGDSGSDDARLSGELTGGTERVLDERAELLVADLQVVDALLSNMSARATGERAARVRRVMQAIEQPAPAAPTARRNRRWRTGLAIAASVLIMFGLLWLQTSQESRANEVLREIGRVSLELEDRVYTIDHSDTRSGAEPHWEGSLYLRGCDGFVVVCGDVVLGRNADECWFVPSKGSVVVAEDFDWIVGESLQEQRELELLKEISVSSRRAPLVQLSAVVDLMQHDYDVTLGRSKQMDDQEADVLTGQRRRQATSDLPNTIRLWSRSDSRIIHRAELSWGTEESAMNQIVLELTDSESVPADWYHHERHHVAERSLRHVSPGL